MSTPWADNRRTLERCAAFQGYWSEEGGQRYRWSETSTWWVYERWHRISVAFNLNISSRTVTNVVDETDSPGQHLGVPANRCSFYRSPQHMENGVESWANWDPTCSNALGRRALSLPGRVAGRIWLERWWQQTIRRVGFRLVNAPIRAGGFNSMKRSAFLLSNSEIARNHVRLPAFPGRI